MNLSAYWEYVVLFVSKYTENTRNAHIVEYLGDF